MAVKFIDRDRVAHNDGRLSVTRVRLRVSASGSVVPLVVAVDASVSTRSSLGHRRHFSMMEHLTAVKLRLNRVHTCRELLITEVGHLIAVGPGGHDDLLGLVLEVGKGRFVEGLK